jgi:hypothetical protein
LLSQFFRRTVVALVLFATAAATHAQVAGQVAEPPTDTPARPKGVDQVLYKGVVGNLLDAVPIDPERRLELQRANAVASSVFSGRSLAVLLGVANPVLMVGGLVWGVWSASKIKPTQTAPAFQLSQHPLVAAAAARAAAVPAPAVAAPPQPPLNIVVDATAAVAAAD